MQADDIRMLFDYSYWGMDRLFAELEKLTPVEFTAQAEVPHISLQALLGHALTAERRQRAWWQGDPQAWQRIPGDAPASPAELRESWEENEREMRAFLAALTDADMPRRVSLEPRRRGSLPLSLLMQHLTNHTIQHRTEAAVVLTRAGHSPGDLDLMFYALEQGMADA